MISHPPLPDLCTAFIGHQRQTTGPLASVVTTAKAQLQSQDSSEAILIFRDATGEQVDVDLSGPLKQILKYLPQFAPLPSNQPEEDTVAPTGPGRPKLGVVSKEVTLLPRHWEWLATQPGGASVTLRKLVEEAKRHSAHQDRIRRSKEASYRFMAAVGGNLPHFEAATRALFASQRSDFEKALAAWPTDVRDYAIALASGAFETTATAA